MIVYAFYGLGKSRFARDNAGIACDCDEEILRWVNKNMTHTDYLSYIQSLSEEGKIVLTNARDLGSLSVDLAFIPGEMKTVLRRLEIRGTDDSFLQELKNQEAQIMNWLKSTYPDAIVLGDNEYVSDYKAEILRRKYVERHKKSNGAVNNVSGCNSSGLCKSSGQGRK